MSQMPHRQSPIRVWLLIAAGLGILAVVAAVFFGPALLARVAGQPEAEEHDPAEIARVSLVDAKDALEAGAAVFVDVRDPGSYAAGHIPGALSMPLDELEQRLGELDPQAWIITYCT
jgi:hypothetical protein